MVLTGMALTAGAQSSAERLEKQARELIAQMTLEEKFSQMMQPQGLAFLHRFSSWLPIKG